jgi:hypothetical protein
VRSSAYGSRFRVQGLESGNVNPMRATLPEDVGAVEDIAVDERMPFLNSLRRPHAPIVPAAPIDASVLILRQLSVSFAFYSHSGSRC